MHSSVVASRSSLPTTCSMVRVAAGIMPGQISDTIATLRVAIDVQSGSDERNLAIDQVGIRGLRYYNPALHLASEALPNHLRDLHA
mgnify:CR=1 FL=1